MIRGREVKELIDGLEQGDPAAADGLFQLLQPELRAMALNLLKREQRDVQLQVTVLIDDAFLRVLGQRELSQLCIGRIRALAARAMREALLDAARKRLADRRLSDKDRVTLHDYHQIARGIPIDLLVLNEALERLGKQDERKSRIVELRFFGGLNWDEIASILDVSTGTVTRDWDFAKVWLLRELNNA